VSGIEESSIKNSNIDVYLIHIRMGEEVVHIEQNVVELRAHAAVAKERVDRIVPAQQGVAVRQGLRRLVVRGHTVDNRLFRW